MSNLTIIIVPLKKEYEEYAVKILNLIKEKMDIHVVLDNNYYKETLMRILYYKENKLNSILIDENNKIIINLKDKTDIVNYEDIIKYLNINLNGFETNLKEKDYEVTPLILCEEDYGYYDDEKDENKEVIEDNEDIYENRNCIII